MFQVIIEAGPTITTGSEKIARAYYDAAVRSDRFATIYRRVGDELVVAAESV